jgi:hypothetical protein
MKGMDGHCFLALGSKLCRDARTFELPEELLLFVVVVVTCCKDVATSNVGRNRP